jgi:hypothetical protein
MASSTKKSNQVVKAATSGNVTATKTPPATSLVIAPDLEAELLSDAGKGFEEANRDSFAVPFLRILQDLSPQVKSKMAGFIPGAKPGMIFNTVSQEMADTVRVIPCHFSQCFIEWKPRDAAGGGGGGFVARHEVAKGAQLMASAVRDGGKSILQNGNELMDTREHYVLLVNPDGSAEGALIALTSAGLKISKRWMSQMRAAMIEIKGRLVAPPMFAWQYKLSAIEEANDKGQWWQWEVSDRTRVTDMGLYTKAKSLGLSMAAGHAKVDYDALATQHRESDEVPGDLGNDIDA